MERFRRLVPWLIGSVLLGLGLFHFLGGFWITDNGSRYLILRNLIENGRLGFAAQNVFFPDGGFHFLRIGEFFYSIYPEYFSLLNLPLYHFFGEGAFWVLPMAGTLLTLWLFRRFQLPSEWTLLLLIATPLGFYTGTFWEMTLSVPFVLGAYFLLEKRHELGAGLLLGAGLWIREEMYFSLAAFGMALLLLNWREWRRYVGLGCGFLAAALPVWAYQFFQYGSILGLHGALYDTYLPHGDKSCGGKIIRFFLSYYIYGFKFQPVGTGWLMPLLGIVPVAMLVFSPEKFRRQAACAALAGYGWLLFLLVRSPEPVMSTGMTVGFWTGGAAFAGWRMGGFRNLPEREKFLSCALTVYCVLIPPLLTQSDMGLIWGARHFLVMMPFALYLSARGFQRAHWKKLAAGFLILAVLFQLQGLRTLWIMKKNNAERLRILREEIRRSEAVVSDVFFLPELLPQLYFEANWHLVKSGKDIPALIRDLRQKKIRRIVLVFSPRFRMIDEAGLRTFLAEGRLMRPFLEISSPGASPFTLLVGEFVLSEP